MKFHVISSIIYIFCIVTTIVSLSGETIFRKKSVRVPAQDGTSISFLIRPTTLGAIDLRMTAKAATAGDAVIKKLLVKVR